MIKPIRRALISVSDKRELPLLARGLKRHGVEILSTGGTASALSELGIKVRQVSEHTGFPEIMAGRVKTLHPKIHGGILARRETDSEVMNEHAIAPIDLVVVNLYPFEATVADPDCSLAKAIENIDIGGPAMIRSAAKNHAEVAVVVDPDDYRLLLAALDDNGVDGGFRFRLATKAFAYTARYDGAISNYFGQVEEGHSLFPERLSFQFHRQQEMRYGENPHQHAALYLPPTASDGIAHAQQVQGKALSYNNLVDADTAYDCVRTLEGPACVIVKHANPCGVATADTLTDAYQRAYRCDPTSAFGGIIAFNQRLDAATAEALLAQQFVEVIVVPELHPDALEPLATKPNVRVLVVGESESQSARWMELKAISGGLLIQEHDAGRVGGGDLRVVTQRAPSEAERSDLLFAWHVAKYVKSNAIVYAGGGATLGIGAGQMSRIDSARIGSLKAANEGLSLEGSVMASDAFFPFADSVEMAQSVGATAIIQPGGSVRDAEVIAAADAQGIAMLFTGMRHFRH